MMNSEQEILEHAALSLNPLAGLIHLRNIQAGWWPVNEDGTTGERNVPEMLCLIHSEISEAMEGYRKGLQDDKLPQYPMIIVELVDALIREFDLLGNLCLKHEVDLAEVFLAKLAFNANRADHKLENRMKEGGKKF